MVKIVDKKLINILNNQLATSINQFPILFEQLIGQFSVANLKKSFLKTRKIIIPDSFKAIIRIINSFNPTEANI